MTLANLSSSRRARRARSAFRPSMHLRGLSCQPGEYCGFSWTRRSRPTSRISTETCGGQASCTAPPLCLSARRCWTPSVSRQPAALPRWIAKTACLPPGGMQFEMADFNAAAVTHVLSTAAAAAPPPPAAVRPSGLEVLAVRFARRRSQIPPLRFSPKPDRRLDELASELTSLREDKKGVRSKYFIVNTRLDLFWILFFSYCRAGTLW